jgi:hypothetical protein
VQQISIKQTRKKIVTKIKGYSIEYKKNENKKELSNIIKKKSVKKSEENIFYLKY